MVKKAEDIRIIDMNSTELGLSVHKLMENAGARAADLILSEYSEAKIFAVCCGSGNNGGDGFVTTRHLAAANKKVKLLLVSHPSKIRSSAAKRNFEILKQMEKTIEISIINDTSKIKQLKNELKKVDVIIDALLGIGLSVEPYDPIKSAILAINNVKKPVVSLDIPSGMWSDKKKLPDLYVKADKIPTFHDSKPCLEIPELKKKTVICSIGVPPEAELFVGKGDLFTTIKTRRDTSHKGENGMVLLIGGSKEYSGAPLLTSRAALRTGVDLVLTCVPSSIEKSAQANSPNIIVNACEGDYFNKKHIPTITELLYKFDSVIIGPGLSQKDEVKEFVLEFIKQLPDTKPLVIDADALKAIKDDLSLLTEKNVIITPHSGEFSMLFGSSPPEKWQKRGSYVNDFAKKYETCILLKGHYDIIADGKQFKINRTGHPGMTVGGTGDVLAGITGAIFAQNSKIFRVACSSAYLAGKAGELAAKDFGNSLLATDVIEKIPEILLKEK
ncbi:MAG: NAD(P)H-hydrate dehydratase [Asgard group archaeon]|nr:NAD(P)H-hydrate dehydratase [Asgard group archaeon]